MSLFLLPNLLGEIADHKDFFPKSVDLAVSLIDGLIAESAMAGRRYLKRFSTKKKTYEMPIALLSEDVDFLLQPLVLGETWGVVSDAGLLCLADPGAKLVKRAVEKSISVKTFVGPSSIFLSLMASGLSGQQFYFHGYPPKEPKERRLALKKWEKDTKTTHIFIEAPYRNLHTFNDCLEILEERTRFCVASNLTLPNEWIHTNKISNWRKQKTNHELIIKTPTVFLFNSL